MPIPDYQTIMLPLLKQLADGKQHLLKGLVEVLGRYFSLTDEEMNEMLPIAKYSKYCPKVL